MVKRIVWIVVGLAVAGGLFLALQPQPASVDVATVKRGDVRSFVEEEGKTRVVDRFVVAAPVLRSPSLTVVRRQRWKKDLERDERAVLAVIEEEGLANNKVLIALEMDQG